MRASETRSASLRGTYDGRCSPMSNTGRSPDDSKVKQKMLYASSKDALRKALVGIATEIQGTDFSEVSYETVLEKVSRSTF